MRFTNTVMESLAYVVPPARLTSADIEERLAPLYKRLKLPEGRLELMTGIRERRFWSQPVAPSEASALAGEAVLARSQFGPGDFDLLVHCAVCRDRLEPATAAYVHDRLKISPKAMIFDLSDACLGLINAMAVAASMIEAGQIRRALLVAGENGKPLVERTLRELLEPHQTRKSIKSYFANLTVGAGSVACVLCHRDEAPPTRPRLLAGVVRTDSSHSRLCQGGSTGADGLEMQTDSERMLEAGVRVARETWRDFEEATGWTRETPDRVICHQVGAVHRRALYQALDLDLEKDFSSFEKLGNVGSVSLPATLAMADEAGVLRAEDRIALLGIGSGLSCMMLAMEWGILG